MNHLRAFLQAHNTLTLATVGPDGRPHACALFYATDDALTLYFLSDPNTAHARHIGSGAAVAATIEANNQDWRSIRGVQLHGFARPCNPGEEERKASAVYAARFPFIGRAESLAGPLARARYYQITPSWIRFIDNTRGFGFKEEWRLNMTNSSRPPRRSNEKAAALGHPSYVWRAGQQRRFDLIRAWARVENADVLVDGAGVGMYSRRLAEAGARVVSIDIDLPSMVAASAYVRPCLVAACEALPFAAERFDTVLSHEVLEHVTDDAQTLAEIARVLRPGGRLILFTPNRLYPFETHGHYWRGEYHFGNTPLINYLPDRWRNQLAPHVRAYTRRDLRELLAPLPLRVLHHTQIYPGYDNIIARAPRIGRSIRSLTRLLERTPFRAFGISHFLVAEKR